MLRRTRILLVVSVVGLFVSVSVFFGASAREQRALQVEFDRRCQLIATLLNSAVREHADSLFSLRNHYYFSDEITEEEFAGIAGDIVQRHRGLQALEWVARVPRAERARVEAARRAAKYPDFEFKERAAGSRLRRAADRPEHFPVLFIHPFAANHAAHGFDLASGITWPALQQAAAADRLTGSGRLPLITDGRSSEWGYILALPVYHQPTPTEPPARHAALRGYVLGIVRLATIIEGTLQTFSDLGPDILFIDPQAEPSQQPLYFYRSPYPPAPIAAPTEDEMLRAPVRTTLEIAVADRTWQLHFRAPPRWISSQRSYQPITLLLTGLCGTFLIGLFLRTQQRHTEEIERQVLERTVQLRESESRLQAIVDHYPAMIFVKDLEGRYLLFNKPLEDLCGRPANEILLRTDWELFPEAQAERYRLADEQVLQSNLPLEIEETAVTPTGTRSFLINKFRLLDSQGRTYAICGVSTEMTDRKAAEQQRLLLERQLLEGQKLESLGVLAGGIAHDFNNILTAILGHATLARLESDPRLPVADSLSQIENAARRAADLCAQMLAYAGKGRFVSQAVDLGAIVRETTALLEASLTKRIHVETSLADGLPHVLADATQLRQIVMNLVINAADAIGDATGGCITLTTFSRELDCDFFQQAVQAPDRPPGLYVGLAVQDNGCGMPPETVARIFEPFFTTKFSGRGLGLSAVLGIVQSHGGALTVTSEPGAGTSFILVLPPHNGTAAASHDPDRASSSPALRVHGTVLIVDDEAPVRVVAAAALRKHGATVLEAPDGATAVHLFRTHPEIDLLLLDLTMPGLSGEETLREMRRLRHPAHVLLMSGFSESETMNRCADLGVDGFLAKPFEVADLLAKVRPLLG